jgi:hypothetical protein
MPAQWALTTENLPVIETVISQVSGNPSAVRAAMGRMPEVTGVFRATMATYNIEKAERNLALMRKVLAELEARSPP